MTRRLSDRENTRQSTAEDRARSVSLGRRRFVRAAGIVGATTILAGCPTSGTEGDAPSVLEGGQADVSTSLVRGIPQDQRPFEDSIEPVNPEPGAVLTLSNLIFQQAGPRGVVVAGDVNNAGDRQLEAIRLTVTLYSVGEDVTGAEGTRRSGLEHGELDAGGTWQWATPFEDPPEELDFFSIDAVANYD